MRSSSVSSALESPYCKEHSMSAIDKPVGCPVGAVGGRYLVELAVERADGGRNAGVARAELLNGDELIGQLGANGQRVDV